jgi:hypothetical protein
MRERVSGSTITVAIAAAAAAIVVSVSETEAQAPLKTPWGEPDLQGIWTDESDTPLQRPAKYANQEHFTAFLKSGHLFSLLRAAVAHSHRDGQGESSGQ